AHRASAAADRGVDEKPPWGAGGGGKAAPGGGRGGRGGGFWAPGPPPGGAGRGPKPPPRGSTGRVGAGLIGPDLPRDEVRFSSRRLGRNPPSGTPVTRKDAAARRDGCSPSPKCGQRSGQDPAADRSGTGRPARSLISRLADPSGTGRPAGPPPSRGLTWSARRRRRPRAPGSPRTSRSAAPAGLIPAERCPP